MTTFVPSAFNHPMPNFRAWGMAGLLLSFSGCHESRSAPPILECTTIYADIVTTHVVEATQDPYRVRPVNVSDRFELKVVYVTRPPELASINLYVYSPGDRGPVLLHQSKHRPPYPLAGKASRFGFTGLQLVYNENARELQYWCTLKPGSGGDG